MKRTLLFVLLLILLSASVGYSETDLSHMSFDELVSLRDQLNLAIWNSKEWQKVEVPAGTYQIGKDIPSGHWTIIPYYDTLTTIFYFNLLDKYGKNPAIGWEGWSFMIADSSEYSDWDHYSHQCDAVLDDGMYLKISDRVYFTPYSGSPDFGFQ